MKKAYISILIAFIIVALIYQIYKKMDSITKNFTWSEMLRTGTGLNNEPNATQKANIEYFVKNTLQPLRDYLNKPIQVTSGFRSKAVNDAVGGVSNSAHLFNDGYGASDIKVKGYSDRQLWELIKQANKEGVLIFDQNILEPSWVHLATNKTDSKNRLSSFEV